jgi:hypothetical protein
MFQKQKCTDSRLPALIAQYVTISVVQALRPIQTLMTTNALGAILAPELSTALAELAAPLKRHALLQSRRFCQRSLIPLLPTTSPRPNPPLDQAE